MSNEKPVALKLAEFSTNWGNRMKTGPNGIDHTIAAELRRQHARIQELEAMLDAVGAGGVSAQRVTQAKDHIEQDLKTVAAPVCETDAQEPVAWRYQTSTGWHATTDASAALRVSKHHAIEPMYTAPQPQADARAAELLQFLQETDQHALDRLIETLEDGEGFDIGKTAIKRLVNLGVAESFGFGRYGVTIFGYWVHEHYWHQSPSLPLKTNLDRDADARAAIAAAKGKSK